MWWIMYRRMGSMLISILINLQETRSVPQEEKEVKVDGVTYCFDGNGIMYPGW